MTDCVTPHFGFSTLTDVSRTLTRLAARLFSEQSGQDRFVSSLTNPIDYAVAVVWLRSRPQHLPFDVLKPPAWLPDYVDLVSFDQRPGRHELHEQGAYYCVDPSSVFMATGLSVVDEASVVLDVCASPGGKSVMAWRALQPEQLWCNEVIGKRIGALVSNLKRCQVTPVTVVSVDTSHFAEQAPESCDVVIVDAPCSGQSLVARGKPSPGCFHPATINMNANRQRRILANAAAAVKPGGWLIYMTCTYSLKENERNVEWLRKKLSSFQDREIPVLAEFRSRYTKSFCYRMWPDSGIGAGGFVAALQRAESTQGRKHGSETGLTSLPVRWTG